MSARQWMKNSCVKDRCKPEYVEGVEQFLNFAFNNAGGRKKIRCPCMKCNNLSFNNRDVVWTHLMYHGILPTYTCWDLHGEKFKSKSESGGDSDGDGDGNGDEKGDEMAVDETISMVREATDVTHEMRNNNVQSHVDVGENEKIPETSSKLMKDAQKEYFTGCKTYSKQELIEELQNLKTSFEWTDKSFTDLLNLLGTVFVKDKDFPRDAHDAKKFIETFGIGKDHPDGIGVSKKPLESGKSASLGVDCEQELKQMKEKVKNDGERQEKLMNKQMSKGQKKRSDWEEQLKTKLMSKWQTKKEEKKKMDARQDETLAVPQKAILEDSGCDFGDTSSECSVNQNIQQSTMKKKKIDN